MQVVLIALQGIILVLENANHARLSAQNVLLVRILLLASSALQGIPVLPAKPAQLDTTPTEGYVVHVVVLIFAA